MAGEEKLAERVARLTAELKEAQDQINRCKHDFAEPVSAYRMVTKYEFIGYEGKGSDPEPRFRSYEEKEYGCERTCRMCGLTQYTTRTRPVITGHEPDF